MCLIAVAFGVSSEYALIIAANRDERHARPAEPAHWWADDPRILGGRDLVAGGSWFGVDRTGRVAAVTNYFERPVAPAPKSRGELVSGFLRGPSAARDFVDALKSRGGEYGGFNMLIFDRPQLHYASNRQAPRLLPHGIYALGNTDPDSDWPKLARARAGLADWLARRRSAERLFDLLMERGAPQPAPARDRTSLFVVGREFGTRCSTLLLMQHDGSALFVERRFDAAGEPIGETCREFTWHPPR